MIWKPGHVFNGHLTAGVDALEMARQVWVVGKESTTSLLPPLCVHNAQLSLAEVYDECRAARAYRLHSMFCYYGQHYHAFIHKEEVGC